MKMYVFLISSFAAFGCSDEFEIRKHIDGRWEIETIRFEPQLKNSLFSADSVISSPGAFIEFTSCGRKQNNHSACDARAFILGFDLQLTYNIREDRVSFGLSDNRVDDPRKIPLEEMLILGHEHFKVTGVETREMVLKRQGLMNLPTRPLQPVWIEIRLSRLD